jgi:uncharacterized protein YgiM (DUF1202 family)
MLVLIFAGEQRASAESQYIIDQVVVSVSATADGSGDHVGSVHSGERVEVLEHDEDRVRIRFGSGQEGWIKASYLSSDPPVRQQLEARAQELDQLHKDNAALQARIAELQRAATPPSVNPAPQNPPPADPAAQDPPMLSRAPPEAGRPAALWLVSTALVALACGFGLGWRVLDRRIRKRYGGLRIY